MHEKFMPKCSKIELSSERQERMTDKGKIHHCLAKNEDLMPKGKRRGTYIKMCISHFDTNDDEKLEVEIVTKNPAEGSYFEPASKCPLCGYKPTKK